MTTPRLSIDLGKIEHNTRSIVTLCQQQGIEVSGVTKGVCGQPDVAKAMLRGGVSSLADSRLANIRRLRAAGIEARMLLLRLPALSNVDEIVELTDMSLNSELSVLQALSAAALARGKRHDVILMLELGDLREGVCADQLCMLAESTSRLPGIRLVGIGANLACLAGVVPDDDNMRCLLASAEEIERALKQQLEIISGMNSSGLDMLAAGKMPSRINHARIGEAILLGRETAHRRPVPGTHQDAFKLYAELLEVQEKPSMPVGKRTEDAFGHQPRFDDRGRRLRALANLGREDADIGGLTPVDANISILGGSSGYLVLDVTEAAHSVGVGSELALSINYAALLQAMTSEYVTKVLHTSDTNRR